MKYIIPTLSLSAAFMLSFTLGKSPKQPIEPAININHTELVHNLQQKQVITGKQLIDKADCSGCHQNNSELIGPSYVAIAKKYKNNDKNINLLADKIIKGGTGVWGQIPMTPHPKISTNDAKTMVKYILTIKK